MLPGGIEPEGLVGKGHLEKLNGEGLEHHTNSKKYSKVMF